MIIVIIIADVPLERSETNTYAGLSFVNNRRRAFIEHVNTYFMHYLDRCKLKCIHEKSAHMRHLYTFFLCSEFDEGAGIGYICHYGFYIQK